MTSPIQKVINALKTDSQTNDHDFSIYESMGISRSEYDSIVKDLETRWDTYNSPQCRTVCDFVKESVEGRCGRDVMAGFVIAQIVEENDERWRLREENK